MVYNSPDTNRIPYPSPKKRSSVRIFLAALCAVAIVSLAVYALLPAGAGFPRRAQNEPYDNGGFAYTGILRAGKFDGQGVIGYADGDRYEGGFKEGRFESRGVFTSAAGWRFEGRFSGGAPVDGVFYTDKGDIAANQEISAYALAGGWSYAGALGSKGQRGEGEFTFADGAAYKGGFAGGLAEGSGVYMDENGLAVYSGEWKGGLFEGKGIYAAPDGSYTYDGEFKGGKFDGQGTLTRKDGTVMTGTWKGGWRVKK